SRGGKIGSRAAPDDRAGPRGGDDGRGRRDRGASGAAARSAPWRAAGTAVPGRPAGARPPPPERTAHRPLPSRPPLLRGPSGRAGPRPPAVRPVDRVRWDVPEDLARACAVEHEAVVHAPAVEP